MTLTLRPMAPADLSTILALEPEIYATDAWDHRTFLAELHSPRRQGLVAELEGAIIAYGSVWETGRRTGTIANIAVVEGFRGQGIGAVLLDALLEEAERRELIDLDLYVRVSNVIAQRLYASRGFVVRMRKAGYYPDNGEDAYVMGREMEAERL